MSIWIKKTFPYDPSEGWAYVQDQFENIIVASGAPSEMLLVAKSSEDHTTTTLVALVPNEMIADAFAGFERISLDQRPDCPSLLVGNQTEFEKYFKLPKT